MPTPGARRARRARDAGFDPTHQNRDGDLVELPPARAPPGRGVVVLVHHGPARRAPRADACGGEGGGRDPSQGERDEDWRAARFECFVERSWAACDDDTTDFFAYDLRPRATTRAASPCVPSASSPSSARWPCSSPSRRRRSPRRPSPRSPTWPLCSRRARPRCARVVFFSLGPRTRISRFQPLSFVVVRAPLEAADGADRARPRPARASRATDGSASRASRGVLTASDPPPPPPSTLAFVSSWRT